MAGFAFVFPGQGSQSVGMLDAWGDRPVVRETLAEASDALGEDLARLIREGPKEALDLTENTQPVMLSASVACYRAWLEETGLEPAAVAGHSLGEYSALVAAGALPLSAALPLVRFRARAMQEAVPVGTGGMAAAGSGSRRSRSAVAMHSCPCGLSGANACHGSSASMPMLAASSRYCSSVSSALWLPGWPCTGRPQPLTV